MGVTPSCSLCVSDSVCSTPFGKGVMVEQLKVDSRGHLVNLKKKGNRSA